MNLVTRQTRPIISANVIVPEVSVGHEITFLIDTGADTTCLSGIDAVEAGLTPTNLGDEMFDSRRVDGVTKTEALVLRETTLLGFEDYSEQRDRWSLHIELLDEIEVLPKCPRSLLGRDVLNRFDIEYSPADGNVEMERDSFAAGGYMCLSEDEKLGEDLRAFD